MVDINARFRYDANFGPLQAQIKGLTRDIALLNSSFVSMDRAAMTTKKQLADSFVSNVNATGRFKAQFVDLTSATEDFGRALEKNRLGLRGYFNEARKAYRQDSMTRRLAERQVRMLQSQVVDVGSTARGGRQGVVVTPLTLDTSDFNTKMQLATQQYAIFNKLVGDGANQLINWGKNTQWAGRQLTVGLTVPLTIFGAMVSKVFREVDVELTRFAKVYGSDLVSVNGAATEEMKRQVQSLAIEYSRTYGIAAKETIALAADIAATGKEGDALIGSVQQTTRLAILGEVDRQEAMRTTLSLQSAFNQDTKELADTINFLNAVENQTSTSLQDFTAAIPKAGPVVRSLGGDIKDLAIMLTAMREGGIPAAEAANAIKSGLSALINPTKAAEERLGKLGVNITAIVEKNRGELMPTLMEFTGVLNELDEFAKAKVIEELFGRFQFARISSLFNNLNKSGSQTAEVMGLVGTSTADLAKAANKEINALTESTSMKFTRAVEGLKSALIPIGEILTTSVIPFIQGTADAVAKVVEVFSNLPGPVKSAGKLLLGLTAIAGPVIMLAGVFGNFLGYITKGILFMANFARRLMGLPTHKLEILDEQSIAASRATDILTQSFQRESDSLVILNRNMTNYLRNLRRTATTTPNLFVPGSPARPLRRSVGGDIPGYGGGDKVPALLEPGEFVVRKEIASKNKGFLRQLNNGTVKGFNEGGAVGPDSGLARSHVANVTVDGRKVFGGLISIENQGYNEAVEKLTDIFPDKKQPLTFREFERSFGLLGNKVKSMKASGMPIPRYIADAYNAMESDMRIYRGMGPGNADKLFKQELSRRMAMGTLSTAPKYLIDQKNHIYDSERKRVLAILEKFDDPDQIRDELIKSAKATTYTSTSGKRSIVLSDIKGSRGSQNFGAKTRTRIFGLYEGAGKSTLPTADARDFITTRGIGVYSPGFREGMGSVQGGFGEVARPGTPREQRVGIGAGGRRIANLQIGEVAVPRSVYRTGAFIDPQGRVMQMPGARGFNNFFPPILDEGGKARTGGGFSSNWKLSPAAPTEQAPKTTPIPDVDGGKEDLRQRRSGLGSRLMNVGFAGSMLAGMTAMNGEVTAATTALSTFTTALMLAGVALEMKGMFGGRGAKGAAGKGKGLLGLRGAGSAMQSRGAATAAGASGLMGRVGGTALLTAGRGVAMLGGPIGIGVAAALTVGILAYQKHQEELENMRKSAKAAFTDAAASAEYFGLVTGQTVEMSEDLAGTLDRMGIDYSRAADQIDEDFVQRVGSDYEDLINRMTGRKDVQAIGRDFELAYSSLISKGFGKDEADAILEEVAKQAQQTEIFVKVKGQWEGIETPEEAAESMIESTFDAIEAAKQFLDPERRREETNDALADLIEEQKKEKEELERRIQEEGIDPNTAAGMRVALATTQQREREALERGNVDAPDVRAAESSLEMAPFAAAGAMKSLIEAYKNAPNEIAPYIDQLNQKAAETFNPDQMTEYGGQLQAIFREAVGDDPALMQIFDRIPNDLEGIEQKTLMLQAASLGLTNTLYGMVDQYGNLDATALDELMQKTQALTNLNAEFDASMQTAMDSLKQESQEINRNYNQRIKERQKEITGLQSQAEAAEESHDSYMRQLEDQSRALGKKSDVIRENADQQQKLIDKQIESLQVAKDEDSFRRQQGQKAMGLLSALGSGDMESYFSQRGDFFQSQQDRSQELAVQALQKRKEQIQEEADAKLKAIEKEQEAIEEARYAAQRAHQDFMKNNREEIEGIETSIEKIDRKRNRILGNIKSQIDQLKLAQDQGFLTEEQVLSLEKNLTNIKDQLPEALRGTLSAITDKLFGPDGEYQKIVVSLVKDMAQALGISEEEAKNLLRNAAQSVPAYRPSADRAAQNNSPTFYSGGYVKGPGTPTSDSIPARLSNGEYVVKASSVRKYGVDALDSINEARFAIGGYVSADRAAHAAEQRRTSTPLTFNPTANKKTENKMMAETLKTPAATTQYASLGQELSGMWHGFRSGIATVVDSFNQFTPPWRRGTDTTTPVGRFIGGEQYAQGSQAERALMAMGLLPIGRGLSGSGLNRPPLPPTRYAPSGQGMLPFLDSTGSSYKPLISLDAVRPGPAAGSVISIGVDPNSAAGILSSGRFKNVHHGTDPRHGGHSADNVAMRMQSEEVGWGLPLNAPADQRPVYGFLRDRSILPDEDFLYGNVIFDMKYDPLKKTTYHAGDSLGDFGIGFRNPWESLKTSDSPLKLPGYGEVQMTPPSLRDVAGANITIPQKHSSLEMNKIKEIISELSRNKIPVKVRYPENFGQRGFPGSESWDLLGPQNFLAEGGLVGGLSGLSMSAFSILSKVALENLFNSAQQSQGPSSEGGVASGSGSQWLANFLSSMGLSGEKLRVAYAIAMRESSGIPSTVSSMDGNGYGLFQMQYGVGHTGIINRTLGTNLSENDRDGFARLMTDPTNNFKVMMAMSRGLEDLSAWGHYSYTNTGLNAKSYQSWLTRRTSDGRTWAQAYIMEPFLRYYQGFPGVNEDPVWAGDQPGSNTQPTNPSNNSPSTAATSAVNYMRSQVGKPYRIPADPPNSWDCSKLTAWAWNQAGSGHQRLTPYSHTQANEIEKRTNSLSGLKPGYVLYFNGTTGPSRGHTSMYVGNGQIVEASSPSTGVRTASANNPWNQAYFRWAGPPKGAGYADGGFILGPGTGTSDSIMARVSSGEYVMRADVVKAFGVPFMDALNSGKTDAFKNGGYVSPAFSIPSGTSMKTIKKQDTLGGNIEYNINVQVASSDATAEEIVGKTMRALSSKEKARRMRIDA